MMGSWTLDAGAHDRPENGVCLMEAVAWVAGEPHSDAPECACPVLAAYGRRLNDRLPHEQRQRLAVFVPRLVGSRASREVEQARAYRLADAAVRVFAPIALSARGFTERAAALRGLAPIVDKASAAAAAAACGYGVDAVDVAAVDAVAAAVDAVDAVAAAAVAGGVAGRQPVWDKAIALLDELCPAPAATFARTQAEYATLVS